MISSENGLLRGTVLLNVRGRDVGSFVDQAKVALAQQAQLPTGYYIAWSGQYENQQRARQRLLIVIPIVLLVIFGLLYITYHSALEAAHVLMAVPFALTGGIYLLWLLGYNFSVAVWVGFIALFGTAVQTGVVMVIYLNEAVERKRKESGKLNARVVKGSGNGRRIVAPTSEGDDGLDSRRRTASDYVEHKRRFRSDEAFGHSSAWRNGFKPAACVDCNARNLLLHSRA